MFDGRLLCLGTFANVESAVYGRHTSKNSPLALCFWVPVRTQVGGEFGCLAPEYIMYDSCTLVDGVFRLQFC